MCSQRNKIIKNLLLLVAHIRLVLLQLLTIITFTLVAIRQQPRWITKSSKESKNGMEQLLETIWLFVIIYSLSRVVTSCQMMLSKMLLIATSTSKQKWLAKAVISTKGLLMYRTTSNHFSDVLHSKRASQETQRVVDLSIICNLFLTWYLW